MSSVMGSGNPNPTQVLEFLKEFKTMECACCGNIGGFLNKSTFEFYCVDTPCHGTALAQAGGNSVQRSPILSSGMKGLVNVPNPLQKGLGATDTYDGKAAPAPKSPVKQAVRRESFAPDPHDGVKASTPIPKASATETVQQEEAVVAPRQSSIKTEVPRNLIPVKVVQKAEEDVKRNMWNMCKYSKTFFGKKPAVHIGFQWGITVYLIIADEDDEELVKFQTDLQNFVASPRARKFTRLPVKNEMVAAEYQGEYYRGRVTNIDGDKCEVTFVDFGDSTDCHYKDMVELTDEFMKVPIFGLTIRLHEVKVPPRIQISKTLEAYIVEAYNLELICEAGKVTPGSKDCTDIYPAILWELGKAETLNDVVNTCIQDATECGWTPPPPLEQEEIACMAARSAHFKETIEIVTEFNERKIAHQKYRQFYFRLDNWDFPYDSHDLPLITGHHLKLMGVPKQMEIVRYKHLGEIYAKPIDPQFEEARKRISEQIEEWVSRHPEANKDMVPEVKQLCLVRWPKEFLDVSYHAEMVFGKDWFQENVDHHRLDVSAKDYANYGGKWFRGIVRYMHKFQSLPTLLEVFILDLGKTTLIRATDLYPFPHRLLFEPQLSVQLSIYLTGLTQHSDKVDKEWKSLLLPGLQITVKTIWINHKTFIVKLVDPTQAELEAHFRRHNVQWAIKKWEAAVAERDRYRKIKKLATKKGTFETYKKIVLEQEKQEKKLEPLKRKYSGIGRCPYDRIFTLSIPHPIPEDYRKTYDYRKLNRPE